MKHALHMELTESVRPLKVRVCGERRLGDLSSYMSPACSGKLFFAPIGTNPQKIIDLGTGTGVWAIEGKCSVLRIPYSV